MTSILKVNSIQSTSSNAAFTINNSGQVSQPNKPMFKVYRTANIQFDGNYNNTKLTGWNDDTSAGAVNIGGMWDTTNDRATVPLTGMYLFELKGYFHTGTYGQLGLGMYVNGATGRGADYRYNRENSSHLGYDSVNFVAHLYLNANDYVEFFLREHSHTTIFHASSGTFHSGICAHFIG